MQSVDLPTRQMESNESTQQMMEVKPYECPPTSLGFHGSPKKFNECELPDIKANKLGRISALNIVEIDDYNSNAWFHSS